MEMLDLAGTPTPILVALACNAIGWVLKKTPAVENKWIPVFLMLLGCLCYAAIEGYTSKNLVLGIVIGAGSVGFHQTLRQLSPPKEQTGEPQ